MFSDCGGRKSTLLLAMFLLVSIISGLCQVPHTVYAAQLNVAVTDVTAPPKVAVGLPFTVKVSVEWGGLDTLVKKYGPPYRIAVNVCEGSGTYDNWEHCKDLVWAPSDSGETVDPSGSKTYNIELTAPERTGVWQLAAWLNIRSDKGWTVFSDMVATREFSVSVVDKFTLTVQIQPGLPSIPVTIDGSPANTDGSGKVQLDVSTSSHTIQVPSEVSTGTGAKTVFLEWSDGQAANSRTATPNQDTTLTAEYKTQYLLTVDSPMGDPQGSGWCDKGASATFSVESPQPEEGFFGSLGGKTVFQSWTGDSAADTATASVTMDGPKTVQAEWKTDNSQPYMILGGIGAAIAVAIILVFLFIRRRGAMPPPPPVIPTRPAIPPPQPAATQPVYCTNCGSPMTYMEEHQRYYCNNCQQYA